MAAVEAVSPSLRPASSGAVSATQADEAIADTEEAEMCYECVY